MITTPRLVLPVLLFLAACGGGPTYDIIVEHGRVVDGTGADPVSADVAVLDGHIAAIGDR